MKMVKELSGKVEAVKKRTSWSEERPFTHMHTWVFGRLVGKRRREMDVVSSSRPRFQDIHKRRRCERMIRTTVQRGGVFLPPQGIERKLRRPK